MKIIEHPNVFLRQESQPVEEIKHKERELMDNMLKTMYEANGVGLAAIQVGFNKRIAVIDTSATKDKPMFLVNPRIVNQSDLTLTGEEGCLSAPGKFAQLTSVGISTSHSVQRGSNGSSSNRPLLSLSD